MNEEPLMIVCTDCFLEADLKETLQAHDLNNDIILIDAEEYQNGMKILGAHEVLLDPAIFEIDYYKPIELKNHNMPYYRRFEKRNLKKIK